MASERLPSKPRCRKRALLPRNVEHIRSKINRSSLVHARPKDPFLTKAPLIAVVDDDDAIRRALSRLLRASDFNVITFASGQAFIDSLGGQRPDCVVMDFQMPGLTGGDVQRLLMLAGIHLPIVIMTAYDHPGIREECLGNGAVACLVKCDLQVHLIAAIEAATASRIPVLG